MLCHVAMYIKSQRSGVWLITVSIILAVLFPLKGTRLSTDARVSRVTTATRWNNSYGVSRRYFRWRLPACISSFFVVLFDCLRVNLFNFLENGWHSGNDKSATSFLLLPSWVSYFSPSFSFTDFPCHEITSFQHNVSSARFLGSRVVLDNRFDSALPCLTEWEARTVAWMDPLQVTQMCWVSPRQGRQKSNLLWWRLKKNWNTSIDVPRPMKTTRRLENGFPVWHG